MRTQCNQESSEFHPLGQRQVPGRFDGGTITSDAGGLLVREVEKRTGIIAQFAACFTDHRDPDRIEHTVRELVAQRGTPGRWATRTSTITTNYARTRCWRC